MGEAESDSRPPSSNVGSRADLGDAGASPAGGPRGRKPRSSGHAPKSAARAVEQSLQFARDAAVKGALAIGAIYAETPVHRRETQWSEARAFLVLAIKFGDEASK